MINLNLFDVNVHFENDCIFYSTDNKSTGSVCIKDNLITINIQEMFEDSCFNEFVVGCIYKYQLKHLKNRFKRKYELGIRIEEKSTGNSWMIEDGSYRTFYEKRHFSSTYHFVGSVIKITP